jgi:rhombotail lipoprotein
MIANLDTQLVAFEERVKSSPQEYTVVHAGRSSGAGALGLPAGVLISVLLCAGAWWARRAR